MAGALLVVIVSLGAASVYAVPKQECTPNSMFIADAEDLCRYHWCIGLDEPVQMLCPPGTRVPTWFEVAPTDHEIPCIIDHSTDVNCLRCHFGPDVRAPEDQDNCLNNPCPSGCTCQDLWKDHFCLCPGNVVPTFIPVVKETSFCTPNPCQNGATCHSQWDTYWCECPRGYTGKNCETPFCGPDTCLNGGTCTVDAINYHCECTRCFDGPCCENQIGSGGDCRPIGPPGVVTPPVTKRPATRPPTTYPPPTTPPTRTCDDCHYGPQCGRTKTWLCDCNPCQSGQICYDRRDPHERECLGKPGPYGSQYTLTFSQDTNGGSRFKRVYVNVGGMSLVGSHRVRIYTPNIREGEACFVDFTVTISLNEPTFYDVPAECLNTESGDVGSKKVLKVVQLEGKEIVVTVANMNGDGYLAIPDSMAGRHFVSHTYSKSGEDQYITVVALQDNTQVLIQKPDEEVIGIAGRDAGRSNVVVYKLNALQSVRYVKADGNLLGTVVVSNNDIHVWSGNQDRQSQKSQEQLATVNRWGPGGVNEYIYIVVGISDGRLNTFDEVHVETAVPTDYILRLVSQSGSKREVSRGSLSANSMTVLGELTEGQIFELVTTKPVQVTHNIVAHNANGRAFYAAYALIPSIQQYAQSYSLQTHGSRDNVGADFTHHYLTLVAMRGAVREGPDYLEQIIIYHYNPATGQTTTYTPKDLGARWVNVRGFYDGVRIELPQAGVYYLSNPSLKDYAFGAIYYAVSGTQKSVQPSSSFPLGCRLDQVNDIRPPVICGRCKTGPNCDIPIVHTCACNPCRSFDDFCTDGRSPSEPRTCVSIVDTTGNPFTLMFMQNLPNADFTPKRELEIYVTPSGTGSQSVRLFTPFLDERHRCHIDVQDRINGFQVKRFKVTKPDCFETLGSGTFNDKALRVQSTDGDLLVYAVNRDEYSADGWVAFPDSAAGSDFYAVCYSPPTYGTEFAVVNIQNVSVTITLTYTATGKPDIPGNKFILQAGEVLQIQSTKTLSDLSGTHIQSDKPVNVYSGNIRARVAEVEDKAVGDIVTGSRDHLVEQLMPVSRWGTVFHIQPIPDRRFGDQVKVIGSEPNTGCTLYRRDSRGEITNEKFRLGPGGLFTRDVVSGNTYRIMCDRRVFVAQITKSQRKGFNLHDPSLITIPPVEQYANKYIFNTPSFSGGTGDKRAYSHRLVLISARAEDREGIEIIHLTESGSVKSPVSEMGKWVLVPGTNYYNIVGNLEVGTSIIQHPNRKVSFMCIFYGYDDRESLGFPIGMRLQVIQRDNLLFRSQRQ